MNWLFCCGGDKTGQLKEEKNTFDLSKPIKSAAPLNGKVQIEGVEGLDPHENGGLQGFLSRGKDVPGPKQGGHPFTESPHAK